MLHINSCCFHIVILAHWWGMEWLEVGYSPCLYTWRVRQTEWIPAKIGNCDGMMMCQTIFVSGFSFPYLWPWGSDFRNFLYFYVHNWMHEWPRSPLSGCLGHNFFYSHNVIACQITFALLQECNPKPNGGGLCV